MRDPICWAPPVFLILHTKKIKKNPALSPTYQIDIEKRNNLNFETIERNEETTKKFKVYSIFFIIQGVVLLSIAFIHAISDYAIPILSLSFLISGIVCGMIVSKDKKSVFIHILNGAKSMLPAVLLIGMASSVKLIMTESGIIDITYFNF